MLKRCICFLILIAWIGPMAGALNVSAESAALYDPAMDRFLYEKESNKPLPMASTTKIMTALLALESLPLEQEIVVPAKALQTEGSSMYLKAGEHVTVEELLYGLLLLSGNDAANVLALTCSGSQEQFVQQMNHKAEELHLTNTHFENPSGLPESEHYSSAADLARLLAACLENEDFVKISGTKLYDNGLRTMKNHNKLLTLYPEAFSGKTGFTKKAGRCLVSAAGKEGGALIAVTLNAPDDWNDHMVLYSYGFESYPLQQVMSAGQHRMTLPVQSGQSALCTLRPAEDVSLRLTQQELQRVEERMLAPHFLYAPVKQGEQWGEIVLSLDGREIARRPLCSEEAVLPVSQEKNLWEKWKFSFKKIANGLRLW